MKRRFLQTTVVVTLTWVAIGMAPADSRGQGQVETRVPIVVGAAATVPERVAAQELSQTLEVLYPQTTFPLVDQAPERGKSIQLATRKAASELMHAVDPGLLEAAESFVVTNAEIDGVRRGLILGADPVGVVYGIYGLLRELGCGYYLSGDVLPPPKEQPFSFTEWQLSNRPLVPSRVVFNWHNFLSGCSTWDLEDWQLWISQSQKMGYNGVMVHAYGNNPMAGYAFKGRQKPVGYLSSTRVGRDWSTNHVNDVRRLYGGDIFESPVFGSVAAVEGTDAEKTVAAQRLMTDVFAHAEQRGVEVYFAVDIDTTSANPQELITLLPEEARFEIGVPAMNWMGQEGGKAWLANPETAAGYEFYKAQVAELMRVYPQIDHLVIWHRKGNTPWMAFTQESMPQDWQREYQEALVETPEAAELWHSHHMFAQAKVVEAYQRALNELGRKDIKVGFGSWDFNFLPAAHRFLAPDVEIIPLDWMVLRDESIFETTERRLSVAQVAAERPVIPIAWAHHDDGNYVGRPYTPYSGFFSRLEEMECTKAGFGIIHWTTKPLDLYFRSLADQVWAASKNQPLQVACRQMASQLVGSGQAEAFGKYLYAWVTTMPKIGRETSDFFIDHELEGLVEEEVAHRQRLELLNAVQRDALSDGEIAWLEYFTGLESYILDIYRTEAAFNRAKKAYAAGKLVEARSELADCRPEEVIERFSKFSQLGGLTRGEEGLVVTMNTRWLPHYVRLRQMLGVDSVRYNYGPTTHDPLAQSRGIFTFHFDQYGELWQCFGTEETGAAEFQSIAGETESAGLSGESALYREICQNGIESDQPLQLTLHPILPHGSRSRFDAAPLLPGDYELTLLCPKPQDHAAGQQVFDLRVSVAGKAKSEVYHFASTRGHFMRLACRGNSQNRWNSIHEIHCGTAEPNGVVRASEQVKEYPASHAFDGDPKTRWAAEGVKQWIEFPLRPGEDVERLTVTWYEGESRQYDFDIEISDDGEQWSQVKYRKAGVDEPLVSERINIGQRPGDEGGLCRLVYPIHLDGSSILEISLKPVDGKVAICGAICRPVSSP